MKGKGGSSGSSEEISVAMFLFIEQIHREPHAPCKAYIHRKHKALFFLHFDGADLR